VTAADLVAGAAARPGLAALTRYFLALGTIGFGGPIALTGAMHRDLVERRRWVSDADFREGLALAQLAPGPLAAQLAMYLGYLERGVTGAAVIAVAFILPSLLMVWAIAIAYVAAGGLPWTQALSYGVNAAIIGIILRSVWTLRRVALGTDAGLWVIAALLAIVTAWLEREVVWLFGAAGLAAVARARHTRRATAAAACAGAGALVARVLGPTAPVIAAAASPAILSSAAVTSIAASTTATIGQIFWFFAKAGAVVFGSGLAIVPFLYGGAVVEQRWLNDQQFLDAVAVAMITPGPVVISVGFIGYLVRGHEGLLSASAGVFLPVFLFVVLPARYVRRLAADPAVRAFVDGVTAAATGAIAGAAVVLARRAWIDGWTVAIGLATLAVLLRWRLPEIWLVAATELLGLWLWPGAR
jgi:chromate transporter